MTNLHRISPVLTASLLVALTACELKKVEAPVNTSTQSNTPATDLLHSRAVQAVIWGMPAVNYDLMLQAAINQAHGGPNQIVFWSHFPDSKNQTLTPNPNAIYLMPFINTKDAGPMVLEIPAASNEGSITGNLDDAWQIALEDLGPAGADKGKGGKYLILPPGYKQKIPAGYLAMPSDTYQNYALLRSIPATASEADVAKALAYGKRVNLYPLSQAAHPPETTFVDATNVIFDSTIPYDLRYFESLNRIVQSEPWLERDKAMIDQLKSIGIEKGKPSTLIRICRPPSSKLQPKRTIGSTPDMNRSSPPTSKALTGQFPPHPMSSKGNPISTPIPTPTPSMRVRLHIPSDSSASSTSEGASSI